MRSFFALLLLGAGLMVLALPLAAQDAPQKETPAPADTQAAPADAPAQAPAAPAPTETPAPPEPAMPPPSKIAPPDIPMEAFGTASPECMEWTDGCRTCKRDAQNVVACSTPGIACIPADISCKNQRK